MHKRTTCYSAFSCVEVCKHTTVAMRCARDITKRTCRGTASDCCMMSTYRRRPGISIPNEATKHIMRTSAACSVAARAHAGDMACRYRRCECRRSTAPAGSSGLVVIARHAVRTCVAEPSIDHSSEGRFPQNLVVRTILRLVVNNLVHLFLGGTHVVLPSGILLAQDI